jgi:hypothetical protein
MQSQIPKYRTLLFSSLTTDPDFWLQDRDSIILASENAAHVIPLADLVTDEALDTT